MLKKTVSLLAIKKGRQAAIPACLPFGNLWSLFSDMLHVKAAARGASRESLLPGEIRDFHGSGFCC
jgi:hypothetical protein